MELLDNPVRSYAWGSRTVIAELLGEQVPSPHPQAELWLGAHPGAPSRVVRGDGARVALFDVIGADPAWALGAERAQRWGDRLPFLLKVLAADEPLSLQAHPSTEQAAVGFAREDALGIDRDAPHRNYRDASHKPELVCALTEFDALAGFREPTASLRLLHLLAVEGLGAHVAMLAAQPDADGLRALFTTWITLPPSSLEELVPQLQTACVRLVSEGTAGEFDDDVRTVLELSERYPGDAGVLCALLLRRITLQPGEAMHLPAGNLHAYLQGAAIEVMASSDNVLRGGLTPKHVDVAELLRVLDFTAPPPPVLVGEAAHGWSVYPRTAEEFRLRRFDGGRSATGEGELPVPDGGARILLCTAGAASVHRGDTTVQIKRGSAVWLADDDRGVRVTPDADDTQLFLATDGL